MPKYWNYQLKWETVFARFEWGVVCPSKLRQVALIHFLGQYWPQPEYRNCARCFSWSWYIVISTSHFQCPKRRARGNEHWKSAFEHRVSCSTSSFFHSCKTSCKRDVRYYSSRLACKNLPWNEFKAAFSLEHKWLQQVRDELNRDITKNLANIMGSISRKPATF